MAPAFSFIYRAIVFIVATVTIVSLPGRVVIIDGIRISLLVNYWSRGLFVYDRRRGRRCAIDPVNRNSESNMSADIYLCFAGSSCSYEAGSEGHG